MQEIFEISIGIVHNYFDNRSLIIFLIKKNTFITINNFMHIYYENNKIYYKRINFINSKIIFI